MQNDLGPASTSAAAVGKWIAGHLTGGRDATHPVPPGVRSGAGCGRDGLGTPAYATGPDPLHAPEVRSWSPLFEAAVLRRVHVAADEHLAVRRALDAGEVAVEHDLRHAGGYVDLGFQDVRLRREE